MSTFSVPPRAASRPNGKAIASAAASTLKVISILVLVALIVLVARPVFNRVVHGPVSSYTVVMKSGIGSSGVVSQLQNDGYDITAVTATATGSAVITKLPADRAARLAADDDVAYVQVDKAMAAQHSWLETLQVKTGL